MKRFFTIFLSSIVMIGLWGQKVPMTVVGDMYIAGKGNVRSMGPVHVKALPADTGKVHVASTGKLVVEDSIIFYSNAQSDGLLMNENPGDAVDVKGVVVRKNFAKDYTVYRVSFPFDVDLTTGVRDSRDGRTLKVRTDFGVQYYDPQQRADDGKNQEKNWKELPVDSSILHKGQAYRIAISYSGEAEFIAKSPADVKALFDNGDKGIDLTYAISSNRGKFMNPDVSEGWNAFGGLNSTNFIISGATVNYNNNRTVYFWGGGTDWEELLLDSPRKGTLRPYAVIFVQTGSPTNLSFMFRKDGGITLASDTPIFRSSQSNSKDILGLWLTDANNSSKASDTYFKFNEGYNKFYRSSEDAVKLNTSSTSVPIVWSLAQNGNNDERVVLFSNCLPRGENEVPLGINIPAAGKYVFSLEEIANETVKSAVLWDKVSGAKTDLTNNNYAFQADGSINAEDRFVIIFSKTATSLDPLQPKASVIYAYADNNVLTVKNLIPGDKVQVLDITGRIIASGVASGDAFSVTLSQKGVYIVNVKGEKSIKVLNK